MLSSGINTGMINSVDSVSSEFQNKFFVSLTIQNLIKSVTFEFESIFDGKKRGKKIDEMLSRFHGISVENALKLFRKENKTFDLFKKVNQKAFKVVNNEGKSVSYNVYLSDIADERFMEEIILQEKIYGSRGNSNIMIEILEDNFGEFNNSILEKIIILKNKGFKIAIDDYSPIESGGNKSHSYLEKMLENNIVPDCVKIDGKLLHKYFDGKLSKKVERILLSMISFLRELHVDIVGEWIRNITDGELAQDIGCTLFQGREINKTNFELAITA